MSLLHHAEALRLIAEDCRDDARRLRGLLARLEWDGLAGDALRTTAAAQSDALIVAAERLEAAAGAVGVHATAVAEAELAQAVVEAAVGTVVHAAVGLVS